MSDEYFVVNIVNNKTSYVQKFCQTYSFSYDAKTLSKNVISKLPLNKIINKRIFFYKYSQ